MMKAEISIIDCVKLKKKGIHKIGKQNFFKEHVDTLAIIMISVIITAALFTLWIMETSKRIDALNQRIDVTQQMIYDKKIKDK